MSSRKRKLTIVLAPSAQDEIGEIYRWNIGYYGVDHADRFIEFLIKAIYDIAENPERGLSIDTRPNLRYVVIRRRSRGHGHIAVYTVHGKTVRVLHVFHSAQDWAAQI
jgi:plasmid stabilization system protein ParE